MALSATLLVVAAGAWERLLAGSIHPPRMTAPQIARANDHREEHRSEGVDGIRNMGTSSNTAKNVPKSDEIVFSACPQETKRSS